MKIMRVPFHVESEDCRKIIVFTPVILNCEEACKGLKKRLVETCCILEWSNTYGQHCSNVNYKLFSI